MQVAVLGPIPITLGKDWGDSPKYLATDLEQMIAWLYSSVITGDGIKGFEVRSEDSRRWAQKTLGLMVTLIRAFNPLQDCKEFRFNESYILSLETAIALHGSPEITRTYTELCNEVHHFVNVLRLKLASTTRFASRVYNNVEIRAALKAQKLPASKNKVTEYIAAQVLKGHMRRDQKGPVYVTEWLQKELNLET